jgi:hypothetical protein
MNIQPKQIKPKLRQLRSGQWLCTRQMNHCPGVVHQYTGETAEEALIGAKFKLPELLRNFVNSTTPAHAGARATRGSSSSTPCGDSTGSSR